MTNYTIRLYDKQGNPVLSQTLVCETLSEACKRAKAFAIEVNDDCGFTAEQGASKYKVYIGNELFYTGEVDYSYDEVFARVNRV